MEIKSSKVTRLVKSAAADSYGKWGFQLEFENGDKGYYNTKNGDQSYFSFGSVADYLIEAKTSKAGGTYFVITHPEEKATSPGFQKQVRQDPKIQFIGYAMSYSKDLIVGGKVEVSLLEKTFERIYNLMISKL